MNEFFGVIFVWIAAIAVLISVVGIVLAGMFSLMAICDWAAGNWSQFEGDENV